MDALQVLVLALQVPAARMHLLLGDVGQLSVQRMLAVVVVLLLVVERHNLQDPVGLPNLLECACRKLVYLLLILGHDALLPRVVKPR